MAEKNVLFSKSFRGYRRKDVNSYILDENKRFSEKEAKLNEEKARLNNRVQELEAELSGLKTDFAAKEEEHTLLLSQKDERLKTVEEKLALADEREAYLQRMLAEERKQYTEEIMTVRRDCESKLAAREEEFLSFAYRIKNRMVKAMRSLSKQCLREVMRGVGDIRKSADTAVKETEERCRCINEGIDAYEEQMKEEVRRIFDEFQNAGSSDAGDGRL